MFVAYRPTYNQPLPLGQPALRNTNISTCMYMHTLSPRTTAGMQLTTIYVSTAVVPHMYRLQYVTQLELYHLPGAEVV